MTRAAHRDGFFIYVLTIRGYDSRQGEIYIRHGLSLSVRFLRIHMCFYVKVLRLSFQPRARITSVRGSYILCDIGLKIQGNRGTILDNRLKI